MRYLVIILLIYLVSCTSSKEKKYSHIQDSIRISNVEELLYLRSQLDSIITTDSVLRLELTQKKHVIDSMIIQALEMKETLIQTELISYKISGIKKDHKDMIHKNDSIILANEELRFQVTALEEVVENQLSEKKEIQYKNEQLQSKLNRATSTFVTGLEASGYGTTSSVFGKQKDYLTAKASRIKKVRISFSLPHNPLAKTEIKNIVAVLYSQDRKETIEKDTSLLYTGIEQKIFVYLSVKDIKVGPHLVDVFINNKLQAQTNLITQ